MLELPKTLGRSVLKAYCRSGLRGGSRAFAWLSPWLAPRGGVQTVRIGEHTLRLDHRVRAMQLMAYGLYEPGERQLLPRLAPPGGVVFDVGANIGFMAAHFAQAVGRMGRVYAFEPSPTCLQSLRALAESGDGSNIQVVAAAVGEATRAGTYYETEHVISHGFGRIDVRPSAAHRHITAHQVAVISLDDFFDNEGLERIDLVKIDVEGAERQVLAGMARIFARGLRPALLMEISTGGKHRAAAAEIWETLTPLGYASYRIQQDPAPVALSELPDGFHQNILWLFSRNSA